MLSTFHGLVEAEADPNTEISVREAARLVNRRPTRLCQVQLQNWLCKKNL
jgi:hypothetical protein